MFKLERSNGPASRLVVALAPFAVTVLAGCALDEDRAIGTDLGRKFVLVLDEAHVAQYPGIETGQRVDDLRIVTSGLARGDVVIVNGLQRVRPSMPVAPRRVAMGGESNALERFAAAGDGAASTSLVQVR